MITVRKSAERGHLDYGWLDTRHTFSFGRYYDPAHMGFRSLRVINEDIVAPGQGFPEHPHRDMEIVTYVVSGAIAHRDSTGGSGTIRPGEVQGMTAGRGIRHSEFNPSPDEPVHLLQIWIEPEREGLTPSYGQRATGVAERRNQLVPIATPGGVDEALPIHQDARIEAALLDAGRSIERPLGEGRHAWIQLIKGGLDVNGTTLAPGDGAAVSDETALRLRAESESEFLLFDLA